MDIFSITIFNHKQQIVFQDSNKGFGELTEEDISRILLKVLRHNYINERAKLSPSNFIQIDFQHYSLYHYFFNLITIIIVSTEPISENKFYLLSLRLIKILGEEISTKNNLDIKKPSIIAEIKDLFPQYTTKSEFIEIVPQKYLDTANVFSLHPSLQQLALTMLYLQEGSVNEIIQENERSDEETENEIRILLKMGYLGQKLNEIGEIIYYCK